ncbi:unnamed protein product, partial [Mesorhabditis spiculigera]
MTTNGKPTIRTQLVLISSEGVETLDLRIRGCKYKVEYFPEVEVVERRSHTQMAPSDRIGNRQICGGHAIGSNDRIVFWIEKSLQNDLTVFYQG